MKAESKLKGKTRKDLETLKHCWFFKSQEVAIRGIPDWIICIRGFFVAIELKKGKTEKAEKLQIYKLLGIRKAGGFSFLAYPENWDEIFEALKQIDGGNYDTVKIQRLAESTFHASLREVSKA